MQLLEQIQNHQTYLTSLPKALELIKKIETDEENLAKLDSSGLEIFNKLHLIVNQLNIRLNSIDPHLLRLDVLNALNSTLSNINNNLVNYKTALFNQNSLNNINTQINNLLVNLIQIPIVTDSNELLGLKDNIASLRHSMSAQKGGITKILNELSQDKADILEEFQQFREKFEGLENQYHQLNEEMSNKLNELNEEYSSLLETTNMEFDTIKNSNNEQVHEALNLLNQKCDELEEHNQHFIKEQDDKFKEEFEEFKDELNNSKEEYDAILEEHKKSVEDLLGIISTNTISSHYKDVADARAANAGNWKNITVISFVATIIFGMYAFMFVGSENLYDIISRIIVTTALGSFTAYAANQVNKYEKQETFNRQMEVELKTLNPYIASFEFEEQIKLKGDLFPQVFGKADRSFNNDVSANLNSPETTVLLKQLVDVLNSDNK